jgi:hypothetical protein
VNATGGGPAHPPAVDARRARDDSRPGRTATRAPRLRTVLCLAKVEASLLVGSVLVLTGLLAGGCAMWLYFRQAGLLWWDAAWRIGWGELFLGMAVLAAAQLAAGRARRAGLADLYASFPVTAATRTLAHLAGLAGVVPASLLLAGAVTAVVQARGAIGTPDVVVLAGGLVLVIAAGAAGVAIGSRFPHPLAGALGALVLLLSSATSHLASGGAIWLVPWEMGQDQLAGLPGPLAGYPPAAAHLTELAGLAVLAAVVALALTARRTRARGGLAAAGLLAMAAICFAGAQQLRPIPTTDLNHLVSEVADPASGQPCTTASQVRYCLYPGFGSLLPSLEAPVAGVLAHLPAQPANTLTIRQVAGLSLPDSTLTHGHPSQQVAQWTAQVQEAPGNTSTAPASAIYLPVEDWPPGGGQLAEAHFDVALAAAEWAVHLPGTDAVASGTGEFQPCVPLDQAREAVAIWLAILATHSSASGLREGLGPGTSIQGTVVGSTFVQTWSYPPPGDYVTPPGGGLQNTAAGYLLASAMTSLPEQKVSDVLASAWGSWLNWHTTDAELAAALGVPMPSVATTVPHPPGIAAGPASAPQNPLCTA